MRGGQTRARSDDPLQRFEACFDEAVATGMVNPSAMVVSTQGVDGGVSSRVVLLKQFDERGFVFYTNLESRKAREIEADPRVSLAFYWRELGKQVLIQGRAEPVSDAEADEYFATRPRQSQVGAWASKQSRPLPSRMTLLREAVKVEARHVGRSVPRPPFWSGYRVRPSRFEFWVEGRFRLHDRTVFEPDGELWRSYKVYP